MNTLAETLPVSVPHTGRVRFMFATCLIDWLYLKHIIRNKLKVEVIDISK